MFSKESLKSPVPLSPNYFPTTPMMYLQVSSYLSFVLSFLVTLVSKIDHDCKLSSKVLYTFKQLFMSAFLNQVLTTDLFCGKTVTANM